MKRVALVHEWFTTIAGSEKVVEQFCQLHPGAPVYAVYADPDVVAKAGFLAGHDVRTSFIQRMPLAGRAFRHYLPLMPLAIEQFDLSDFDVVISSNHAVAKGVITGPDQLHISYVHSPIRYAWDLQAQYLRESGLERGLKSWLARALLFFMRNWDYRTANGVDHFVANSKFIARRIWKVYRRQATVIYPPVDVASFSLKEEKEDYFLAASRLVPYKRMDLIVQAFAGMPERQLVVIGDGPEMKKLEAIARHAPNIRLLGYQPAASLRDWMQRAKAFVFAAEEDFGITPVEAQACGTPVIAFGKGGALETVRGLSEAKPTGVFFPEQTVSSLCAAVELFEQQETRMSPLACRENAERFSTERFREEFSRFVAQVSQEQELARHPEQ